MSHSAKTIVICSDGTGNSYSGMESNVLRLYSLALKECSEQIACYEPGIGTLPLPRGRTVLGRGVRHASELFFGTGAIENVTKLYVYLMEHYEPLDRIFLFGFSRGAFTVRALAGMLHLCGLLRKDDVQLVEYAAGLYQTSERRIKSALQSQGLRHFPPHTPDHTVHDREASQFKSLLSRPCTVAFLGIWDTVKAYGWIWPRSFPALRHNPSVETVRHAVALDERRAAFQMTGWGDRRKAVDWGQEPIKEVWFAGDHSDIGGGHAEGNSALADASLVWMLGEATAAGLKLDEKSRKEVATIVANSESASAAQPNDLRKRCWYWGLPLPRMELDNSVYPPYRLPKCLPTGIRKPAEHAEEDLEEGPKILLHASVGKRSQVDARYRADALLGRGQSAANKNSIKVSYEDSQAVTNFAEKR
jgi:uncharacterized protein (DUF2235 family)